MTDHAALLEEHQHRERERVHGRGRRRTAARQGGDADETENRKPQREKAMNLLECGERDAGAEGPPPRERFGHA